MASFQSMKMTAIQKNMHLVCTLALPPIRVALLKDTISASIAKQGRSETLDCGHARQLVGLFSRGACGTYPVILPCRRLSWVIWYDDIRSAAWSLVMSTHPPGDKSSIQDLVWSQVTTMITKALILNQMPITSRPFNATSFSHPSAWYKSSFKILYPVRMNRETSLNNRRTFCLRFLLYESHDQPKYRSNEVRNRCGLGLVK